jgi:hypothetical protein
MFRTLIPTTLALLLAPSVAFAAPQAALGTDAELAPAAPAGHENAARDKKKDSDDSGSKPKPASTKRSRGGSKSPSSDKGDSDRGSRGSRPDGGDRGSDDRGSDDRGSDDRGPRDPGSRDGDKADPSSERGPRSDSDRDPYGRPDSRESEPGSRDIRSGAPGETRPDPSARPPMTPRAGGDGSGERTVSPRSGEMPRLDQPSVRKLSVGGPGGVVSPANRIATEVRPSNLRGGDVREAVDAGRHGRDDGGSAEHSRGGRDDRSSDAERARYGSERGSDARRDEVRGARHTAGEHREAAHYRRSHTASRHSTWASYRHHRYNRWYAPGGWFRPWRPGHTYWYHGVFAYGPYPWYRGPAHVVVVNGDGGGGDGGGRTEAVARGPKRSVDRAGSIAVGVRGGSYLGGYDVGGGAFGDAGLGLALRYRPIEPLGLELSWMHHSQTWSEGSERVYQPIQASVQLFAAPWTKVNPYALAGVTVTPREVDDQLSSTKVTEASVLVGPHGGLGIEFGLGKKASINFDARYTGYLNKPVDDLTIPGAFQANMGLNFYF